MAIYGTLAEADTYLAGRADTERWLTLSVDEKERNLQTATLEIDSHQLAGAKYVSTQELEFPRDDSPAVAGVVEVPTAIERACYEQAAFAGTPEWKMRRQRMEAVDMGVGSVSVEGVSESYVGRRISPLCARAMAMVRPYLLRIGKVV